GWSPRGSYSACSVNTACYLPRARRITGAPCPAAGPARFRAARTVFGSPRPAIHVAPAGLPGAQDVEGTATRYFRQESRNEPAWGCRRRCTENRKRGCTGSRTRRMPASSSNRLPLRRLHLRHAVTTFVHVVSPPRDRGSTWSTV